MKHVGLHLRIFDSLHATVKQAIRIKVPFFQFFLTEQHSKRYIDLSHDDINAFRVLCEQSFETFFIHGSYRINPSSCLQKKHYILDKELRLAKRLGADYFILHPGTSTGAVTRGDGLDALARTLNYALRTYQDITIVLENIAYGEQGIGGRLKDFYDVKTKLDFPDRVKFCIDTAHAYAYGYDLACTKNQDVFLQELEDTIGIENIVLIHLNDTHELLGSKKDRHGIVGKGNIGSRALKRFALHKRLKRMRFLLELPFVCEEELLSIAHGVDRWFE